jgi:NitT/TauT family transport system permease protein
MLQMRHLPRSAAIVATLLVWIVLSTTSLVPELFLPSPWAVMMAARTGLADGSLISNLTTSCMRVLAAFIGSLILALPTALLIERTRLIGPPLESLIDFLRYIPVPALIPISIVFFGVDEIEKFFLLFAGTYFQMVVLVVDGFRRLPQEYFDIFYSLKLRGHEIVWHLLRAAAPDIFDTCRITFGWCWSYVVLAEVVGAQSGIGHALELAQRFSNTPAIYLWMILVACLGMYADQAFRHASLVLFRFRDSNFTERTTLAYGTSANDPVAKYG